MAECIKPVMFGEPTPAGRKAGDCYLCQDDGELCDCQLRYIETEGGTAGFSFRDGALAIDTTDGFHNESPILGKDLFE